MIIGLVVLILVGLLTAHTAVNARWLRRPADRPDEVPGAVAVLLPLRNEAHRVRPCLTALLAQRGVPRMEITVLDDGSTDGTAELVRELAGDRIRLLCGGPLPGGWLGKPWACHQLAARSTAPVLVFLDADVVLAPDAIAAAAGLLAPASGTGRPGFDLVSPYPRLLAGSLAERLIQPLLAWSWLTFLPLRAMERSARPSLAAAGGQFLVLTRAGYQRAGGHAAVRDRVLEDIELARACKRAGGRIALADGSRLARARMYESWAELREGYGKSLWASFGSPAGAAAVVLLLLLVYVLPLALLPVAPLYAAAAYLVGVAGRLITARATGGRSLPDALAHPIGVLLLAYLLGYSYRQHRRGRLAWKGRPLP